MGALTHPAEVLMSGFSAQLLRSLLETEAELEVVEKKLGPLFFCLFFRDVWWVSLLLFLGVWWGSPAKDQQNGCFPWVFDFDVPKVGVLLGPLLKTDSSSKKLFFSTTQKTTSYPRTHQKTKKEKKVQEPLSALCAVLRKPLFQKLRVVYDVTEAMQWMQVPAREKEVGQGESAERHGVVLLLHWGLFIFCSAKKVFVFFVIFLGRFS